LAQQPPPGGFEILVVDGMSDDGTREILDQLASEDSRVRVIENPKRITPYAMNAGIHAARGRFIAIMGAHNRYAPDYLLESVKLLEETGVDNVGGAMICDSHTLLQQAIALAHHSRFAVGWARWHDPGYEGPADTVFGGVYRREVFDRIGLFDEGLLRNQDDELNLRLTRAGGRIWQSPRIRSWYEPRRSLAALFRQYLQYGYWKVHVIRKHRRPASIRHLVPGAFVLLLGFLGLMGLWWSSAAIAAAGLLAVYILACSFAAVASLQKAGWRVVPLLVPVFVCYHFGYGLGFLRGLLEALLPRRRTTAAFTELTRASGERTEGRKQRADGSDQPSEVSEIRNRKSEIRSNSKWPKCKAGDIPPSEREES
jgi:glycosyltransferase involved in cell wall biosynthesis